MLNYGKSTRPRRETPAAEWAEIYEELYHSNPGTFLEIMHPQIIAYDAQPPSLLLQFQMKPWMRNPRNTIHGGIIASMADISMGGLARLMLHAGAGLPTAELSVNYLRPVPFQQSVRVKSFCRKQGHSLVFLNCQGFLPSEPSETLFTASAVFYHTSVPSRQQP